jgi:DNA polymerase III epsilon subunit-like protein
MTWHVIDFETTTPSGFRPEPIEVAVITLQYRDGDITPVGDPFTALMKPPPHAPVTPFDTDQTGITPQMTDGQPPAAMVLAELDAALRQDPALLVAHSAPVEGGLLYDYREHCPRLARTPLLDTVTLARKTWPDLPSHSLDALMTALDIPRPADRHRALADTEVTAELFRRILRDAAARGLWASLRDLRKAGGRDARAAAPAQLTLFT